MAFENNFFINTKKFINLDSAIKKTIKFSVVISVYINDDVNHFIEAMNSLLRQTLMPSEIILTVDGPISQKMESVVSNFENNPIIRIIRSNENIGLGRVRHLAILSTTTDVIAVMDADDISIDNRFELQVRSLIDTKADVVGGYISEFIKSIDGSNKLRRVPLKHEEIVRRGKWIQPFNHVTIMFNKLMYIKSGGYGPTCVLEDSYLFLHMVINNARFINIPTTLVYVRADNNQLSRRHGIKFFKEEFFLLLSMFRSGYINLLNFITSLVIRSLFRLVPIIFLRFFTKLFFRRNLK